MAENNEDQLLRRTLGKTADCIPLERLESPDARAHLATCAYCRNELAMLTEFRDAAPRPEEAADLAWVQARLAGRSGEAAHAAPSVSLWSHTRDWLRRAFPAPAWGAVAVAALVLVMAGGMYLRDAGLGLRPPTGEQVLRSQKIVAVAPVGDVAAAPAALQWEALPGAHKYLVRVMEMDRTEIWRGESIETRIELPAGVRRQMTAYRTFSWTVTAQDKAGSTLGETDLQTFHILATAR